MPLSPETKERIAHEAAETYPPGRFSTKWLKDRELDRQQAYIAGAEAWAERAAALVGMLESMLNHPMTPHYMKEKITEELNKYNSPTK